MADRTVRVTIVANATGYVAGMEQAARKTRDLGSEAEKLAQKRAAFNELGRSMLAIGVAAGIAVGVMVSKFVEFDRAMSQVQAVTQESAEGMHQLRDAALEAGGATVFTATEAANAIEELGKNGLTTADILSGALDAALDLAAAGNLEVARAAEIAAITAKQFNLTGSQLPHVADLMAAGAGKAAGDVEDMAQALSQAGLVSNQTGLSIEEATGTLAAFADAGLLGSDAGTSLRTMLLRLTPLSGEAADKMAELGINAFDASGNFVGMAQLAGILETKLGTLNQEQRNLALTQIFGQDAIRGANLLYDLGSDGLQRYIDQTNDSGYAAKVAADRLNNLAGDVEKLGGAFDTAFIKTGAGANDILRSLVQTATFLIDTIGGLPEPVLNIALALGVAAGAVALVGGAALLAVPKWAAFKTALEGTTRTVGGAVAGIGVLSGVLTVVTLAIGFFASEAAKAQANSDAFADSLDKTTGELTNYTRELVAKRLEEAGAFDVARKLGISQRDLTDAVIEGGPAFDRYREQIAQTGATLDFVAGISSRNATGGMIQIREELARGKGTWADLQAAMEGTEGTTEGITVDLGNVSSAAADASGGIDALADSIAAFNEQQHRSDEALLNYRETILDVAEAMGADGFTGTLDVSTQQGIDNRRMLMDLAGSANDAAAEVLRLGGSQEEANAILDDARWQLESVGSAFGLSGDALQQFIDKYLANPNELTYQAVVSGIPAAQADIDNFVLANDGRQIALKWSLVRDEKQITVDTTRLWGVNAVSGYALGGYTGTGSKYQAAGIVHRGEFVSTSETLAKPANRQALEYMHAGGDLAKWAPAQYLAAAPVPNSASLSLDGMRITGSLDIGNGIVGLIDGRLEQQARNQTIDAWAGDR